MTAISKNINLNDNYRGRFAPSPSGSLHFGSLVAALGSWLDARHHQGKWLVRVEDIDPPREVAGAAEDIIRTLELFGLYWDESVSYQSKNLDTYQQILHSLLDNELVYRCICTRKQIKSNGGIYANQCRSKQHSETTEHSLRLKVTTPILSFKDCFQSHCQLNKDIVSEDFILQRKDGLYAYMLAVVVDDINQQITHVIRGADLLDTTTQQLYLFDTLKADRPIYGHLPLAVNNDGTKLSKQNHALPISCDNVSEILWQALMFLQQSPPTELQYEDKDIILNWAIKHWQPESFSGTQQYFYDD